MRLPRTAAGLLCAVLFSLCQPAYAQESGTAATDAASGDGMDPAAALRAEDVSRIREDAASHIASLQNDIAVLQRFLSYQKELDRLYDISPRLGLSRRLALKECDASLLAGLCLMFGMTFAVPLEEDPGPG